MNGRIVYANGTVVGHFTMKKSKNIICAFIDVAVVTGWLIGLLILVDLFYPQFGLYLEKLGG